MGLGDLCRPFLEGPEVGCGRRWFDSPHATLGEIVPPSAGMRRLHELVAGHAEEPEQVVVGIETERGLMVQALLAAGYQVYAITRWQ